MHGSVDTSHTVVAYAADPATYVASGACSPAAGGNSYQWYTQWQSNIRGHCAGLDCDHVW
jgi:hypothetical protein